MRPPTAGPSKGNIGTSSRPGEGNSGTAGSAEGTDHCRSATNKRAGVLPDAEDGPDEWYSVAGHVQKEPLVVDPRVPARQREPLASLCSRSDNYTCTC